MKKFCANCAREITSAHFTVKDQSEVKTLCYNCYMKAKDEGKY